VRFGQGGGCAVACNESKHGGAYASVSDDPGGASEPSTGISGNAGARAATNTRRGRGGTVGPGGMAGGIMPGLATSSWLPIGGSGRRAPMLLAFAEVMEMIHLRAWT
jgi:hypothetical protein